MCLLVGAYEHVYKQVYKQFTICSIQRVLFTLWYTQALRPVQDTAVVAEHNKRLNGESQQSLFKNLAIAAISTQTKENMFCRTPSQALRN